MDKRKRPLGHCTTKRARQLIEKGRACVYRYYPFTIIIKDLDVRKIEVHHDYRIKPDPGAGYTGISIIEDDRVIAYFELQHRGSEIVDRLQTRRNSHRNRRSRETGYRRCKFPKNGVYETSREKGWLPPSQMSILNNVLNFVRRLEKLLGPCKISIELVKFDMQLLENLDIKGEDYQHVELYNYELKTYLLEKYQRTCQYCANETGDHRLEKEHMVPKSRRGSDSLKNLILACHTCNQKKADRTPEEWLDALKAKKNAGDMDKKRFECLEKVVEGKKVGQELRYAAWTNSMRWRLYNALRELSADGTVSVGIGGRTAYNRNKLGIPKAHHLDALCCTKEVPENGYRNAVQPCLVVKATGRGGRLLGTINDCGIITTKFYQRNKRVNGIQTGDIVQAVVSNGKYKGTYTGRVKVRRRGDFDLVTMAGKRFPLQEKPPLKCCSGWMVTSIHLVRQFPSAVELPSPLAYYSWKSWIWTHRIRINTIRWSRDTRKSQRQRLITKLDSVRHHCRCRFFGVKGSAFFQNPHQFFHIIFLSE